MTSAPDTRPGVPWRTALVGALLLTLLPWLFALFDSGGGVGWAMVVLVLINPLLFVAGSLRSWIRYRWKAILTVLTYSAAFLVSVFTVYNSSALVYLAAYLVLTVLVVVLYSLFNTVTRRRRP